MHGMNQRDPEIRALENEVKYYLNESNKKTAEADDLDKEAGKRLRILKNKKPYGNWDAYVKREFGIGKTRADDLIRIGDGTTTADKLRADRAERDRRYEMRKKAKRNKNPPSADGGFADAEDDDTNLIEVDFTPPKVKTKPNKEAVKYCSKAIDVAVKFHDQFTTWLRTKPDLSEDDREALATSIQSAADTLARLAQQIR